MPRTIRDVRIDAHPPAEVEQFITNWLQQNGFPIVDPRSTGAEKVLPNWDGDTVLHPRPGSLVALQARPGGASIVLEVGLQGGTNWTTVHVEGYTTGRGPGWKGKEYEFVPSALAVAGIPRKRGLALLEGLVGSLNGFVGAPLPPPSPLSAGYRPAQPLPAGSLTRAPGPATGAERARDKARQRKLATVAYAGIGLIVVGFAGQAVLSSLGDGSAANAVLFLSFGGIILVSIGGFGLIALGNQQLRRPVGPGPVPPTSPQPYYATVPFLTPPLPTLPDAPPPTSRTFDLSDQAAAYHKRMRFAVLMRRGMYAFLIGLGIAAILAAYLRGNPAGGLGFGGFMIAFGLILFAVIGQVDRAPVNVTVDEEGVRFGYPNSKATSIRWADPRFGMRLTSRSEEVNRNLDPPVAGPTYTVFTGMGSGLGRGQRVWTEVPRECFELVLQRAQLTGLQITPRVEGIAGTMSELQTYRISRPQATSMIAPR